jgi:hypothetical protein
MADAARMLPRIGKERRRRRIERELRALQAMRGHLATRDIALAILAIGGVALLILLVGAKLHWLAGSILLSVAGALAAGLVVWLIGRRWLFVAWLIVLALFLIAFEDGPPDFGFGDGGDGKPDRKEARRAKLERAIEKREALLAKIRRG